MEHRCRSSGKMSKEIEYMRKFPSVKTRLVGHEGPSSQVDVNGLSKRSSHSHSNRRSSVEEPEFKNIYEDHLSTSHQRCSFDHHFVPSSSLCSHREVPIVVLKPTFAYERDGSSRNEDFIEFGCRNASRDVRKLARKVMQKVKDDLANGIVDRMYELFRGHAGDETSYEADGSDSDSLSEAISLSTQESSNNRVENKKIHDRWENRRPSTSRPPYIGVSSHNRRHLLHHHNLINDEMACPSPYFELRMEASVKDISRQHQMLRMDQTYESPPFDVMDMAERKSTSMPSESPEFLEEDKISDAQDQEEFGFQVLFSTFLE